MKQRHGLDIVSLTAKSVTTYICPVVYLVCEYYAQLLTMHVASEDQWSTYLRANKTETWASGTAELSAWWYMPGCVDMHICKCMQVKMWIRIFVISNFPTTYVFIWPLKCMYGYMCRKWDKLALPTNRQTTNKEYKQKIQIQNTNMFLCICIERRHPGFLESAVADAELLEHGSLWAASQTSKHMSKK